MTGQPERAAWQRFVAGHPDGNIFHTPAFDDVAAGTEGWASRPLAAVDRASGELMALWPAVHTTVLGGLLRPLTTRAVLFGGCWLHLNLRGKTPWAPCWRWSTAGPGGAPSSPSCDIRRM